MNMGDSGTSLSMPASSLLLEVWIYTRINWSETYQLVVGKHVITIEGLGDVENPHPLQERIAKLHGSQ